MKSLFRNKKGTKYGFLILGICLLYAFLSTFSFAANVITNGTFNGNLNSWTLSEAASGDTDDGILYNTGSATADGTGCMRGQTMLLDADTWVGNATQNFTVDYVDAHLTSATFNFTWRKWSVDSTSAKHDIKVELIDPGSTVRYTWTHTALQAAGTGAWNPQTNIDVKSNIQAGTAGSWTVKISWDLQAGTVPMSPNGQCGADFDDISLDIVYDTTAPTTTISVNPATPDGENGWYKTTPTITLTSNEPGTTYYSWVSATGPWTTYTGSFTASEGQNTLYYYSRDTATNDEAVKNQLFKVDITSPTSNITDPTANARIKGSKVIIGTATDTNFQEYNLKYGVGTSPSTWYDIGTNPHTIAVSNGTLDTWNTTAVSDGVYTIKVTTTDWAGKTSSASVTVTVDNTPPTVTRTDPLDGSVGVVNSANVYATFSETMDASTITTSTFTLYDTTDSTSVAGSVTYDSGTRKTTFDPTVDLQTDHNYTVTITTGVKDLVGNNMASNYSWSFSTRPPQIPSGLNIISADLRDDLSWNLNPEPLVYYRVYRATSEGGSYSLIYSTGVGTTSYSCTIPTASVGTFWYKISAIDSGTLNESSPTFPKRNDKIQITKAISASAGGSLISSNAEFRLDIPSGALSADATFSVEETTAPSGAPSLASGYFDTNLSGGVLNSNATLTLKYSASSNYLFVAHWTGTEWEPKMGTINQAQSTISLETTSFSGYGAGEDTTPPTAPATCDASQYLPMSIEVTWTAASDPETGISNYKIYRGVTSPPGILAGTVSGETTSYIDEYGIPGETYYYAVSAVNGIGLEGAKSPEDSETVPGSTTPHDTYGVDTAYCQFCHEVHGAAGNVISRKFPEIEMCYTCHDGTGSTYNIRVTYENLAAHDTKISLAPRGVKCLNCHYPHGTGYTWMTRESEENLCFKAACHDNAAHTQVTTIRGWNIYSQFKLASYHAITSPTADGLTGAKVECSSCHGPHTVQHTTTPLAKVSNPENTYKLANASGTGITLMTDFCLKCHDGTWPEATYASTTFVPYTITFPDMPSASYPFFTGWNKSAFTSAGHYVTTGTKAYCNTCHHPHGSSNARLTAYNYNNTSTYAEENLCYACHGTTPAAGADNIQSQATKTYRHPIGDYTGRHRDTETASGLGSTNRHAECVDCHNPHQATSTRHTAPGNLASGVLKGVVGVEPNPWPTPNVQPRNIPAFPGSSLTLGAGVCIVKAGDFFYAISGGSVRFWRYNPSNNAWQLLRDATAAFGNGAALAWTGGDYIYAFQGGGNTTFYRYSISGDSWATMTAAPAAVGAGGSLVWTGGGYIYALRGAGGSGGAATITFWAYSIANNNWTTFDPTDAPLAVGAGGSLLYTGSGDRIYALRGDGTTTFWSYSIANNNWTTFDPTDAPLAVGAGGSLLYTGSGDRIYALRGGGTTTFWSYSIANNNWTTFDPTDAPAAIGTNSGNRLVYDGSAYIYALRGVTNGEFWRYRISTDLWNDGVAAPSAYTLVKPVEKEYQLCLKCHSNYTTQPTGQRNLAESINPMTVSHHPIAAPAANRYCDIDTMEPPWNQQQNGGDGAAYISPSSQRHDLMYCSDCHGSDANDLPGETTNPTDPLGPHGSNVSKLLRAPIASNATDGTPLCYICHKKTNYWTGPNVIGPLGTRYDGHPSSDTPGMGGQDHKGPAGCLLCHMGGSGVTGGKPASYREYTHGSNIVAVVDTTNRGPVHAFMHGDGMKYIRQADMVCWTEGYCGTVHTGGASDTPPFYPP